MPTNSSADRIIQSAKQLIHALNNPSPATPFEHVGDEDVSDLKKIAKIFEKKAEKLNKTINSNDTLARVKNKVTNNTRKINNIITPTKIAKTTNNMKNHKIRRQAYNNTIRNNIILQTEVQKHNNNRKVEKQNNIFTTKNYISPKNIKNNITSPRVPINGKSYNNISIKKRKRRLTRVLAIILKKGIQKNAILHRRKTFVGCPKKLRPSKNRTKHGRVKRMNLLSVPKNLK